MALLAVVLVVSWQALLVTRLWDGNWTALFCAGSRFEPPAEAAAGLYRFPDAGYDAQFYRLAAKDPWFRKGRQRYHDDARLRYRRGLIPVLAWLLSAGHERFTDAAYAALILAGIALGVYWTAHWLRRAGCDSRCGLAFLFIPATLTSADRLLLDGPFCALVAGYGYHRASGRRSWQLPAILVCAPLLRETGLLLTLARLGDQGRDRQWRAALQTASTILPAAAWYLFVHAHTAPSGAWGLFRSPLIGQLRRLADPSDYRFHGLAELLLESADIAAVLGLLAACFLGLLSRPAQPTLRLPAILFAILGLALGAAPHLRDAYGFARPVSPLLLILVYRALAERRWLLALPVLPITVMTGVHLLQRTIEALRTFH